MKTAALKLSLRKIFGLTSVLLMTSCGTYLSVYDNDGIYNREVFERQERSPVVVVDESNRDEVEENYFARKLESLERIEDNEIFTDVDSYASESEFEDVNYAPAEPWGQENDNVVVSLNLWNDPFWGGFNNWGWGFNNWGLGFNNWGWGFNDPWFHGNFGPFWGNPFWGGNRFWRNRFWGFNNWGWGFNNPWIWQGGFRNGVWGNRFWRNNWFQNNRYSRSLAYRNYRNRRGYVNNRYTNNVSRRSTSTVNRRTGTATNRRSRTINNSRRNGVTVRSQNGSSRNRSTVRRGTNSSNSRATSRRSSSSNRRSYNSSRSSSRNRSFSSSRSSSRSSGSRGSRSSSRSRRN